MQAGSAVSSAAVTTSLGPWLGSDDAGSATTLAVSPTSEVVERSRARRASNSERPLSVARSSMGRGVVTKRFRLPHPVSVLVECGTMARPLGLASLALLLIAIAPSASSDSGGAVTALGRLEPRGGVIRVAGPSHVAVVITDLSVQEGDVLEKGQVIARLDSFARHRANVAANEAMLEDAKRELARSSKLQEGRAASIAARDSAEMKVKVARAHLAAARAELELAEVRAPMAGQVLAVHAKAGERVDADGIIELGRTDEMYAIAEVYETDIGSVREGQLATITSPALPGPLTGRVERIGLMVAKMDVLDTDPVAKTDARIIEVDIRLRFARETATILDASLAQPEVDPFAGAGAGDLEDFAPAQPVVGREVDAVARLREVLRVRASGARHHIAGELSDERDLRRRGSGE